MDIKQFDKYNKNENGVEKESNNYTNFKDHIRLIKITMKNVILLELQEDSNIENYGIILFKARK